MKMKKVLALLMAMSMTASLAACGSKDTPADGSSVGSEAESESETAGADDASEESEETTPEPVAQSADTLIVGTPSMNGDFIEDFGNSSYDLSIKVLTDGYYYTVHQTDAGELAISDKNVVESYETTENEDGSKTYTFTIFDDLKWNNGDPITASDYVASILWRSSPEWAELGGSYTNQEKLVGYASYFAGETDTFAGVKLVDDYTFSLTIDAQYLPYFYELSAVNAKPIYLAGWAPDATVESDDNGSKLVFASGDLKTAAEEIANNERFAPTVTSGPYKFVSFENQIVTMEMNENFKCDYNGDTPKMKYVVQEYVNTDTDVDQVIAGQVDLVTGIIEGSKIDAAKASDTTELNSYLRSGYGMITFACDFAPTDDANVRWALACLIDRSAVLDYVLGGYGGTVDSVYGMAQWTYQEKQAELAEKLKPLTFNVQTANEYLDQTEWKYESDGVTPFDASKATSDGSYMRYNSDGEMLTVEHCGSDNNDVTDIIEIQYAENAPLAGVKFNVTKADFNTLLNEYYYGYQEDPSERRFNSFNMATNFTAVDDKYESFNSARAGSWLNANQIRDDEIDRITEAMRACDPEDKETYADLWVEFEVRIQELMPAIPLYSNEYFDIYRSCISGVETTPYANYEDIICKITKAE